MSADIKSENAYVFSAKLHFAIFPIPLVSEGEKLASNAYLLKL